MPVCLWLSTITKADRITSWKCAPLSIISTTKSYKSEMTHVCSLKNGGKEKHVVPEVSTGVTLAVSMVAGCNLVGRLLSRTRRATVRVATEQNESIVSLQLNAGMVGVIQTCLPYCCSALVRCLG